MGYKDAFNEWAAEFWETTGRDPDLNECEEFRCQWINLYQEMVKVYQFEEGEVRCF